MWAFMYLRRHTIWHIVVFNSRRRVNPKRNSKIDPTKPQVLRTRRNVRFSRPIRMQTTNKTLRRRCHLEFACISFYMQNAGCHFFFILYTTSSASISDDDDRRPLSRSAFLALHSRISAMFWNGDCRWKFGLFCVVFGSRVKIVPVVNLRINHISVAVFLALIRSTLRFSSRILT